MRSRTWSVSDASVKLSVTLAELPASGFRMFRRVGHLEVLPKPSRYLTQFQPRSPGKDGPSRATSRRES